jgi:hypothetical protein
MQYIVTSDAVGLAIGPMAETANDVQEALNRARQMFETGLWPAPGSVDTRLS